MSDESSTVGGRDISNALLISLGLSLVLAIAALVWCFALNNHMALAEHKLAAAEQKNAKLEEEQQALTNRLRATTETLGQSVGLTQRQIEVRTQALMASQAAALNLAKQQSERTAQLAEEEKAAEQKLGAVQSDVSTVKTDVGGAKASIAATQSDLDQTKQQLQRTIGDEHQMSGLIATNHDQLELLKHKGDRNYYEFTLQKGAKPTLLSTIKVQAKKVDEKHSRYTLMVSSDDRNIEKKDRTLDEPLQFYSGKDPVLYEIVVNNISKNTISGYLSTPKGVPQPAAAPSN